MHPYSLPPTSPEAVPTCPLQTTCLLLFKTVTHWSITVATEKWVTYRGTHLRGREILFARAINYSQQLVRRLTSFHYKSPGKARDGGKTSQPKEGCI